MTIPNSTSRVHLDPYWRGDSVAAINAAARKPFGKRFTDTNVQCCADDVMCLHWGTASQGGWRYIVIRGTKRRRRMTSEELHRPIGQWKAADVKLWRQTAKWGRSFQSRVRPLSFSEFLRAAKRRFVRVCPELKSRAFASNPGWAKRMVAQAQALKTTFYPMTLVTMAEWGQKLKNFHDVGCETALLAHGARRPADIDHWRPYISVVWGSFRGGVK